MEGKRGAVAEKTLARGAEVLREVKLNGLAFGFGDRDDVREAARILRELAESAVDTTAESTALQLMVEFVRDDKEALFDVGRKALLAGRYRVALKALDGLEAISLEQEDIDEVGCAEILGLLGHFVEIGPSAAARAFDFLRREQDQFRPSLKACLAAAVKEHYSLGQYDTADALLKLERSFEDSSQGELCRT